MSDPLANDVPNSPIPHLSVVMPAFNEEANLRGAIEHAILRLDELQRDYEIIVVNDGSTDNTGDLADALAAEHPGIVRALHNPTNLKLGGTLRHGYAAARGTWVLYTDSDRPCDMANAATALEIAEAQGVDIVSGFRVNREADGPWRLVMSRSYTELTTLVVGQPVADINFAFKLMRRTMLASLALSSAGSFIHAEMFARARELGFTVAQFPVYYTPRVAGVSTLASPRVIAKILTEMAVFTARRRLTRET